MLLPQPALEIPRCDRGARGGTQEGFQIRACGVSLPISPALTDEIIDQTAATLAKVARHFAD